jgi:hypothetical protein
MIARSQRTGPPLRLRFVTVEVRNLSFVSAGTPKSIPGLGNTRPNPEATLHEI